MYIVTISPLPLTSRRSDRWAHQDPKVSSFCVSSGSIHHFMSLILSWWGLDSIVLRIGTCTTAIATETTVLLQVYVSRIYPLRRKRFCPGEDIREKECSTGGLVETHQSTQPTTWQNTVLPHTVPVSQRYLPTYLHRYINRSFSSDSRAPKHRG